jgi:hypothetical protein
MFIHQIHGSQKSNNTDWTQDGVQFAFLHLLKRSRDRTSSKLEIREPEPEKK